MNDHQVQLVPVSVPLSLLSTHQNSGMPLLETVCLAHRFQLLIQKVFFNFWVTHLASDSIAFEYYLAEFNIAIERDKRSNPSVPVAVTEIQF